MAEPHPHTPQTTTTTTLPLVWYQCKLCGILVRNKYSICSHVNKQHDVNMGREQRPWIEVDIKKNLIVRLERVDVSFHNQSEDKDDGRTDSRILDIDSDNNSEMDIESVEIKFEVGSITLEEELYWMEGVGDETELELLNAQYDKDARKKEVVPKIKWSTERVLSIDANNSDVEEGVEETEAFANPKPIFSTSDVAGSAGDKAADDMDTAEASSPEVENGRYGIAMGNNDEVFLNNKNSSSGEASKTTPASPKSLDCSSFFLHPKSTTTKTPLMDDVLKNVGLKGEIDLGSLMGGRKERLGEEMVDKDKTGNEVQSEMAAQVPEAGRPVFTPESLRQLLQPQADSFKLIFSTAQEMAAAAVLEEQIVAKDFEATGMKYIKELQVYALKGKFISINHFYQENEVTGPGKTSLGICNFCDLSHNFSSATEFRNHFTMSHALFERIYKCTEETCNYEVNEKSLLNHHTNDKHSRRTNEEEKIGRIVSDLPGSKYHDPYSQTCFLLDPNPVKDNQHVMMRGFCTKIDLRDSTQVKKYVGKPNYLGCTVFNKKYLVRSTTTLRNPIAESTTIVNSLC